MPHSQTPNRPRWGCGLTTGLVHAFLLSPWDRAIFLSNFHKRPFLDRRNLSRPFEGVHQTLLQRMVTNGLYFPLVDLCDNALHELAPGVSPTTGHLWAGSLAGALNAVVTNPLSLVKYQSWGSAHEGHLLPALRGVWHAAGLRGFARGLVPTLYREATWGGVHNALRHGALPAAHQALAREGAEVDKQRWSFAYNTTAALAATVVCSPFNFVRNIHFGAAPTTRLSTRQTLQALWQDARGAKEGRLRHLQRRLLVGWGTLRVGVGMGLASQVYELCRGLSDEPPG